MIFNVIASVKQLTFSSRCLLIILIIIQYNNAHRALSYTGSISTKTTIDDEHKDYSNSNGSNWSRQYSDLADPSNFYLPVLSVPIHFDMGTAKVNINTNKEDDSDRQHGSFYAVMWPQDSEIEKVVERVSVNGTSPFSGKSVIIYPDQLLEDLTFEKNKLKKLYSSISPSMPNSLQPRGALMEAKNKTKEHDVEQGFWRHYNANSILHYDTQCTIVSAMSMFVSPRVLIFGSRLDSKLFCKAALDLHPQSRIYFLENDERWLSNTRSEFASITATADGITYNVHRSGFNGNGNDSYYQAEDKGNNINRCEVIRIKYDTILHKWMDMIGEEDVMAKKVLEQLPSHVGRNFDVILVRMY